MMAEGKKLKEAQAAYERMARVHYELPDPLQKLEWIRPFRSTAPYDALRGATRALSNLEESLFIHPITVAKLVGSDDTKAARVKANEWETTLKWQLKRANRRYRDLRNDAIWSVALYDEAIAQLIHLPTEFAARPRSNWFQEAAFRFGDWAVRMADPKTIYVDYSEFMPVRVLRVVRKSGPTLLRSWPDAKSVKNERDVYYVEYDMVDENGRVVWYTESSSGAANADPESEKGTVIMGPEPWLKTLDGDQVPFLPWVSAAGGTSVDLALEHQRKPLLYPVYRSEQWAMTNVAGTLAFAQELTTATQPKGVVSGPGDSAEDVTIDHTDPSFLLRLTTGQQFQQLNSYGLDRALTDILDRHESAIQRATLADVLVTGRPISGEQAFASYNLQVQQAIASLGGIRGVGEDFFEQLYEKMLMIAHYTGSNIEGYSGVGDKYVIDSEDIDPDSIQLDVELKADVPADRLQRINGAATLVNQLGWSRTDAAKYLGEDEPEEIFKRAKIEAIELADLQAQLQKLQLERSGELQQLIIQAAQQLVAQQQAQLQQGTAPQGQPQPGPGQGQGFNPAAGGQPPIEAQGAAATFEGATGQTRAGGATVA